MRDDLLRSRHKAQDLSRSVDDWALLSSDPSHDLDAITRGVAAPTGAQASAVPLTISTAGHALAGISVMPRAETASGAAGGPLSPDMTERIEAARGHGTELDAGMRDHMEGAFATSFAGVHIHADGEANALNRAVGAVAFTTGSDIFFRSGAYQPESTAGRELLAHELTHVVQQHGAVQSGPLTVGAADTAQEQEAESVAAVVSRRGSAPQAAQLTPSSNVTARMISGAPVHTPAVQRKPAAGAPAAAKTEDSVSASVLAASLDVDSALDHLAENQRSGLERLGKALQHKKPEEDLVGNLAAAAVGGALMAILGPVGPAAEALVLEEDEIGRKIVKKAVDLITEKTVEKAKEGAKEYVTRSKKTDPIDNFIEAQSLGINQGSREAKKEFHASIPSLNALPNNVSLLKGLSTLYDAQAQSANALQLAHSAGAWSSLIAAPGEDSKAWANDDKENHAEQGALEIEAKVAGPIRSADDLAIVKSNWRGMNKETERVLQEHGNAKIQALGVNLRIVVSTPVGETRCEIRFDQQGNPIVPEKSDLQGVMAWLLTGKMNTTIREDDRMMVVSAAAALGYYMLQKPVSDLQFD